jgi:hypothetical protein
MGSNGRLALSFCASHPKETDNFEWWWGFANALSGLEAGEIARLSVAYRVLLMVPVFPLPAESRLGLVWCDRVTDRAIIHACWVT